MPIYEFVCNLCDEKFDALTSISRVNEVKCPKCAGDDLKRLISMFSSRTSGGSSHGDNCAGCASGQCGTSSCSCH